MVERDEQKQMEGRVGKRTEKELEESKRSGGEKGSKTEGIC